MGLNQGYRNGSVNSEFGVQNKSCGRPCGTEFGVWNKSCGRPKGTEFGLPNISGRGASLTEFGVWHRHSVQTSLTKFRIDTLYRLLRRQNLEFKQSRNLICDVRPVSPNSPSLKRIVVLAICTILAWSPLAVASEMVAESTSPAAPSFPLRVVVNSNRDGEIQADDGLTLREAIALLNGTLSLEQLSPAETAQVDSEAADARPRIEFDLPTPDTTIRLHNPLPPLIHPNLILDGTSQPGYGEILSTQGPNDVPSPVVAITVAEETEIARGLTIAADQITVRGLSIYGFSVARRRTASTPPANIFIARQLPALDSTLKPRQQRRFLFQRQTEPPQGVVIEQNWIGIAPLSSPPPSNSEFGISPTDDLKVRNSEFHSAFGISVFNAVDTRITQNWIANHGGSGIITGVRAENTQIKNNVIEANGLAGMPDAIRLEGNIAKTQILSNRIADNDGSGIFLFKPQGAVEIQDNEIVGNGRRQQRAAIYLMGSDHQVTNNNIREQKGPGVVVAAFPRSDRNLIRGNTFGALEGLSIDLVARQDVGARALEIGDGPNPKRNSPNRRRDTANQAINAPAFLSPEFLLMNNQVDIDGIADPGSTVAIYQVTEEGESRGPLGKWIAEVVVDAKGRFGITLDDVEVGDRLSAIATHPEYGTSEPALNVVVHDLQN